MSFCADCRWEQKSQDHVILAAVFIISPVMGHRPGILGRLRLAVSLNPHGTLECFWIGAKASSGLMMVTTHLTSLWYLCASAV